MVQATLLVPSTEDKFREYRNIVKRVFGAKVRRVFAAPSLMDRTRLRTILVQLLQIRLGSSSTWAPTWALSSFYRTRIRRDPMLSPNPLPFTAASQPRPSRDIDERDPHGPLVPLAPPVDLGTLPPSAVPVSQSGSNSTLPRQLRESVFSAPESRSSNPDVPLDRGSISAATHLTSSNDAISAAANPTMTKGAIPTAPEGPSLSLLNEKPCDLAQEPAAAAGAPVQSSSQLPGAVVVATDQTGVRAAAAEPIVLGQAVRRAARIAECKAAKAALPAAHDSAELVKAEHEPETEAERAPETVA
ncbi:hypothetical protein AMAG_10821 [Allomyces macrogynus ATCC 38327]|uniref:Uncharacterized protein n=1 Tax=Allomyces macrogynus (strain ATCC 38327) TaxID=578462 RepID=A0A0L0SRH9_ALLM3|nr:hypothetical protein AMAG_10821 [Allomyces macrogynus ATCC 38327]|eukprot:KNE65168.1 hypothetical protein AMAG_10821 [Allomyces macrogynus ATCC 38327]